MVLRPVGERVRHINIDPSGPCWVPRGALKPLASSSPSASQQMDSPPGHLHAAKCMSGWCNAWTGCTHGHRASPAAGGHPTIRAVRCGDSQLGGERSGDWLVVTTARVNATDWPLASQASASRPQHEGAGGNRGGGGRGAWTVFFRWSDGGRHTVRFAEAAGSLPVHTLLASAMGGSLYDSCGDVLVTKVRSCTSHLAKLARHFESCSHYSGRHKPPWPPLFRFTTRHPSLPCPHLHLHLHLRCLPRRCTRQTHSSICGPIGSVRGRLPRGAATPAHVAVQGARRGRPLRCPACSARSRRRRSRRGRANGRRRA
jgi:hypothetical protein